MIGLDTPDKDGWYAGNMETEGHRIDEPGTGKPIILRRFQYARNPAIKRKPTKEDVLTPGYIKYLENGLWADNMEMIMEPKVVIDKKHITVFATCQAKKGNLIESAHRDQLKPLQDKLAEEREPQ
jgi:hypothetical protein